MLLLLRRLFLRQLFLLRRLVKGIGQGRRSGAGSRAVATDRDGLSDAMGAVLTMIQNEEKGGW